jgi:hypothetical protein
VRNHRSQIDVLQVPSGTGEPTTQTNFPPSHAELYLTLSPQQSMVWSPHAV